MTDKIKNALLKIATELVPTDDPEKIKHLVPLADRFAQHVKPNTNAQLLFTLDKKNPNHMTEWTVASEPTKDYTDADEWRLIANGMATLQKIKERALLLALQRGAKQGDWTADAYLGDQVKPTATLNGKSIKPLFFNQGKIGF